jgi:hypothetical protein
LALVLGLALAGGGFDLGQRHIAGLAAWALVILLLVFGGTQVRPGRWFYWSVGLTAGLALLSGLSSFWSGSAERSAIEADRVLVYLGFLVAAWLLTQTELRRQRFAEGLAVAAGAIAVLALTSRLLPHVISISDPAEGGPRLSYPLGYWNADGAMFGIALALLLWLSRRGSTAVLRWAAVAATPATVMALYFTYSRGGLLAAAVAVGCLLALSHDRLWLLALTAAALLCTLPAMLATQARDDLANNLAGGSLVDQGQTVFLILLAGTAVLLGVFAAMLALERRGGARVRRALEISRHPRTLRLVAAGIVVVALAATIAVGQRAWDRFSSPDIRFPTQPQQHFGEFSGAGRHDFWRVALNAFEEKPIFGHGAGSYEAEWDQHRSIDYVVKDAHSLYFESLAELGIVGGALVLALAGGLLWCGLSAWRNDPGAGRERSAALLAAALAFAVSAAFDWSWEMAGLGAVFFLAAGVLVGVRDAQLATGQAGTVAASEGRPYGVALAGLGLAFLSSLLLAGPYLVQREIHQSQDAAAAGDLATAVDHANTARSIEPWASSPYVQLGLLAELQGDNPGAVSRFSQAIDREDRNWELYLLRARAERKTGQLGAARSDVAQARRLNPLGTTGPLSMFKTVTAGRTG